MSHNIIDFHMVFYFFQTKINSFLVKATSHPLLIILIPHRRPRSLSKRLRCSVQKFAPLSYTILSQSIEKKKQKWLHSADNFINRINKNLRFFQCSDWIWDGFRVFFMSNIDSGRGFTGFCRRFRRRFRRRSVF